MVKYCKICGKESMKRGITGRKNLGGQYSFFCREHSYLTILSNSQLHELHKDLEMTNGK